MRTRVTGSVIWPFHRNDLFSRSKEMPIYEFECTKCGNQTEVWQRFSDKPLTKCEKCKGKMKKLISQSTFHLKGSGWYVTDYASGRTGAPQEKKETSSEKKEPPSGEKEASKKPEKSSAPGKSKKAKD